MNRDKLVRSIKILRSGMSCYEGEVKLTSYDGAGLDIRVSAYYGASDCTSPVVAEKSMNRAEAINIRDALIEMYPLEWVPKPKAVYSVGDKSSFGSVHPKWEACYPIIKTYRREAVDTVGYAGSMQEAETMAAALNTTRE